METSMMPFAGQHFTTRWVFMQDGDRKQGSPHVKGSSKLMRAWFSRNRVRVLDHSPQSPDLNPIEHLWEELKQRAKGRKFRNKDEAWEFYRTEWERIPRETLEHLVSSMPRRLDAVIRAHGNPTKY